MDKLTPMFFSTLKGYTKGQFVKDVIAGIVVAIIALPLSIALAIASGVTPQEGLYTAIIAGFLISFLGGSHVQIAGPTAAFATIVAGIVATNGMEGLILATLLAGVFLILMGVFRFGSLIKFIPYTITTGFTAGIAVTILVGQFKDFFGVTYAEGVTPIETVEKLEAFFESISTINPWAILIGGISLLILIVWPKISKLIPGSLIAVVVGAAMVKLLNLEVNTIGSLYTVSSKLPVPSLPSFSFDTVKAVLPDALTIAVLAAIESLLSCVVADGMTGTKHRSNTELIAQGVGNMGSALFGGIPATGAIARTAANIKSGGRTPVAGMVHAVVLLLVLVLFMPYASLIPMPTIAAILFSVAYNMCQWRPFLKICKTAPKSDIFILIITFVLTVVFDLVVAIVVGLVLACVLFMKRMSDETAVKNRALSEAGKAKDLSAKEVPSGVLVYEIDGPLFFGSADRIAMITAESFTKCLILRMRGVTAVDATAMNAIDALYTRCAENGIKVVFSHVNEQPMRTFTKAEFVDTVGKENFCKHIDDALTLASKYAKESEDEE